jgi:hypothetical protein
MIFTFGGGTYANAASCPENGSKISGLNKIVPKWKELP